MTEAEHVALSTAMRNVIYFINLIQEIQDLCVKLPHASKPKVTCQVFEDKVGALELSTFLFSCSTSVNVQWIRKCWQKRCALPINVQMFAKALPRDAFGCLGSAISGW